MKLGKKGKYAQDYPKDFIVIPVLEANEIFQKGVEELEEDLKMKNRKTETKRKGKERARNKRFNETADTKTDFRCR